MTEPRATRPYMPGYGIDPSADGMLPWSWALLRLRDAHDYWIATVWPDGRPHLMPVWGCWDSDGLWFSSAHSSRKVRNLVDRDAVTVATDDPRNPVVVDGIAEVITDHDAVIRFADALNDKYRTGYPMTFFEENALVLVRPRSAFGVADDRFTESPTRWRFDPARDHARHE
jgi:PPOX class probable F420-dependent enzyme